MGFAVDAKGGECGGHCATTGAEDGCQQYDVMLPNNDPKHVLVVEKWRDEASHSAHLNGPSFAKARDASKEWIVDRKVTTGITE